MASEWKKRVNERVDQRKDDMNFYSLSEDLDRLDAILYSDCTALEIEALDLIAVSTCNEEQVCHNDFFSFSMDGEVSDDSLQLAALECGFEELAEELGMLP